MALFVWQANSALSGVCDADINNKCLAKKPGRADKPGKVLECLAKKIKRQEKKGSDMEPLAAECKALVDIAEPPDEMEDFNNNLQVCAAKTLRVIVVAQVDCGLRSCVALRLVVAWQHCNRVRF
jgi:Cysteine rich repeat